MLTIQFNNLEEVRQAYNPDVVRNATKSAMDRLSKASATAASKAIRDVYPLKAGDIRRAFKTKTVMQGDDVSALMIYTSPRIPLSEFAGGKPNRRNRPKVSTARGTRYGAKVRVVKSRPAKLIPGAFWARSKIFRRVGSGRLPVKQMTGPGVAQMVRSQSALDAINATVSSKADAILAERLNFYSGRRSGVL